ncbi:zinc-ribbon domain-containing protein [Thalassotalea fusca]
MRDFLRFFGPLCVVVGGVFAIIGFVSFFRAFGNHGTAEYFWCAFVGLPLVGVGVKMCKIGYLKPIADYVVNETGGALSKASSIIKNANTTNSFCTSCGNENSQSSKFCSSCGAKVT